MTTTVEAVYQNGKLILMNPLPLQESAHVLITIQSQDGQDSERAAWAALSEQALMKAWDNPGDDVFDELLSMCLAV